VPPSSGPTDEGPAHGLAELIAERRAKGARIRAADPEAFPYRFPDVEPAAAVLAAYEALARSHLLYAGVVPPLWDIAVAFAGVLADPATYTNLAVSLA